MKATATARLAMQQIRPSASRVAIMRYLLEHPAHPTADAIWRALQPAIPSLSKTTVYNTLKLFAERSIVETIDIDSENVRYDATIREHAHFRCDVCGSIHDIDLEPAISDKISRNCPEAFGKARVSVHLHGVCPRCRASRSHPEN
ncbi:MAG: transcriptional repressor [Prevotellaceae bacterium]|nr:transcriptional repressor [Prevotellaceae bacterium]